MSDIQFFNKFFLSKKDQQDQIPLQEKKDRLKAFLEEID